MMMRDLVPDLVVTNGRFQTLDPHNSIAQAVAIKDGRFLAIGSSEEINAAMTIVGGEVVYERA